MRTWTPGRPQEAQRPLDEVDGDDDEAARGPDLDDGLGLRAVNRAASDDALDFPGLSVPLAIDDLAREDSVLEVEDREVFIFKFFSSVK